MLIRCMIKSVHPNKRFTLFQLSCACTCGGCITKVHHMKFREAVSIPGHVSVHWEMRNSSSREQLLKWLNMTAQIWRLWLAYEWKWFWYLIRGNQSHIHWALAGVGPSDAFHMFDHNGMWGVFDQSQKVNQMSQFQWWAVLVGMFVVGAGLCLLPGQVISCEVMRAELA